MEAEERLPQPEVKVKAPHIDGKKLTHMWW
jgi:hypothetical protein